MRRRSYWASPIVLGQADAAQPRPAPMEEELRASLGHETKVTISQQPPGPDENRVTVTSGTRDVVLDGPHDFDGVEFPDGTAVLCASPEDERAFRAEREPRPESAVVRVAGALWFAKVRVV